MEITVNINEEAFKSAVQNEIANIIEETVTKEIENNVGDLVESTLEEKLSDIESYVDIPDLVDKIEDRLNYDEITDNVYDRIDLSDLASSVSDYMDDTDVEDKAQSLLNSYDPGNSCSLGRSFTEAIKSGIEYLLESDPFFRENVLLSILNIDKNEIVQSNLRSNFQYQNFLRDQEEKRIEQEKARIEAYNRSLEEKNSAQATNNIINNQQSA